MKFRRIVVVSLAALSLLMTSCGGDAKPEEPLSQDYGSYIGKINSLGGIRVDNSITHLFEDEDGNIYYAFSDRYDLDDKLNMNIEAYGIVMDFESLDKPKFKITRTLDAPEVEEDDTEVKIVEYTDTDLGFSMSYPDSWSFASHRDAVELTAPTPKDNEDENYQPDVIVLAVLDTTLTTTSDNEQGEREADIRSQVSTLYADLNGITPQASLIGVDQQLALKYKKDSGDIHFFIPRGEKLVELSLFQVSEGTELDNSIVFSEIVNSFRLLPASDSSDTEVETEDVTEESTDDATEDSPSALVTPTDDVVADIVLDSPASAEPSTSLSLEPIPFDDFREFESSPYKFKMSYPKNWYYSGGNMGYDFADEPIEDNTVIPVRLDINSSQIVGTQRIGTDVRITVEVNEKFYTISGPSDQEALLTAMIQSIQSTDL